MFGNPKGEMIICEKCKREHNIRRGTMCICACGEEIYSKEYVGERTPMKKEVKVTAAKTFEELEIYLVVELNNLKGKKLTKFIAKSKYEEFEQPLIGKEIQISILRYVLFPRDVETLIKENYVLKSDIITDEEIKKLETLWDVGDAEAFEVIFKKHLKKLKDISAGGK